MGILQTGFIPILFSLALYGFLHSVLASRQSKSLAKNIFGTRFSHQWYRLFFNLVALVSFLPVLWITATSPDQSFWQLPSPWNLLFRTVQLLALVGMGYALLQTGSLDFLGLRQLFEASRASEPKPLVTGGLYRLVRHPIYTFGLALLWFSPSFSVNSLAFALGITGYILLGIIFEERKLEQDFGKDYLAYKRKTPALIPGLKVLVPLPVPVNRREDR